VQTSRSFLRDNRGVTEIIASLIILLIVSIAGVALYSYSMSAFSSSSSSFQQQIEQREEQARERFQITAVWWNTVNQLNLTVLNYGKTDLAIDAVYINRTPASISSGRGATVGTGELVSVKLASSVLIQDGQTYEIIAVSERGSKNAVYWKA
jgi:hypothetical protein